MSKIYLMLSIWLLCGTVVNAACASPNLVKTHSDTESSSVKTDADITGKIVKINRASSGSNNKDFLGNIYVEGGGNYDRANINIKTQTRILISRNGKKQTASFDDLQINARIQAAFSGPVLESYPVQATAVEIIILADGDANEDEPNDKTTFPLTKTDYIRIEGERRRVTLRLFDEVDLPFAVYYPENDFSTETGASDEGQSLRFVSKMGGAKNENAYVHIFFPYGNPSFAQIGETISGNRGLLQTNGWRVNNVKTDENYKFSWMKKKIFFSGKKGNGFVLIGEQQNRLFYVIVHYGAEYAEGFLPRVKIVLENLFVKSDKRDSAAAENSVKIPASLRPILEAEYPNWKTARLSENIAEFFRNKSQNVPSQIIKADFDGNAQPDYALNIIYSKKGKLFQDFVVFFKARRGFSKRVLETFPYSDTNFQTGVFLLLKTKGQKGYDYEAGKKFRFKNDSVEIVYFEKASSAYIFEKGKFRSILMSD